MLLLSTLFSSLLYSYSYINSITLSCLYCKVQMLPWHIKRTAILFSTARTLGFIGVCDIFSIVLCPFKRFPSACLGILLTSICDINCDMEHLHITATFLCDIVHRFIVFYRINLWDIHVCFSVHSVHSVLFRIKTLRDSPVLVSNII